MAKFVLGSLENPVADTNLIFTQCTVKPLRFILSICTGVFSFAL